ncbi:transposase [Cupriavidus sp. USMAHM13]|uniref:transposase n=1 Tax=Cupriavidus sp. USMAHM13 TaxID=1389192 RepID=UPI0009F2F8C4
MEGGGGWKVKRYPAEYREWVVEQMMSPLNRSVIELVKETGVTTVTLRTWRAEARKQGRVVPGRARTLHSQHWSRKNRDWCCRTPSASTRKDSSDKLTPTERQHSDGRDNYLDM